MMKKRWILFMMCACISGLGGCGKQTVTEKAEETETADSMKEDTTELCAYIKEINGNTLVIDPVEYISSGDSDRLASYKHTDDDMPDGYYIYNKDEKTEDVTLTDQTEYSFLDTYTDAKPGMPFFLKMKGNTVIQILEKPMV